MQYDFSREDALLVRYGDSVRRAVITPGGDMPEGGEVRLGWTR